MSIRAVIFDLGGVVVDSPLHAIARYERANGLPENCINHVVAATAPTGAWSRLERGEVSMDEFFDAFERDCAAAGHRISARAMMEEIAAAAAPRPKMLHAIATIRGSGLRCAALTNNWVSEDPAASSAALLHGHFDVVVESAVEGLRKPDPRIYRLALERLSVRAEETVFLDDIGANLKPARAMGMKTIKVEHPDSALSELAAALDLQLG